MSATIYKHELRAHLRSVIIWSLSVAAIIFFFYSLYPAFSEQAEILNQMLSRFPPALLEAFGMGKLNLASVLGFYSFLFIFVQLCLAIQAGNYGFGLVSVEESELTADFLLSKPVSRVQVLTSKLLAAFTGLTLTNLVIWAFTFLSMALFASHRVYSLTALLLLLASIVIFQLFFLCVGLVISLLVRRVRSVTPYSLGLGFGTYVLSAFSGVFGDVKLEYITPFKHLDPAFIVTNVAFDTPLVALNLAISVVALAASYWLYLRRDIHAVS
jgi:ABC-2 type transport system permease protein